MEDNTLTYINMSATCAWGEEDYRKCIRIMHEYATKLTKEEFRKMYLNSFPDVYMNGEKINGSKRKNN